MSDQPTPPPLHPGTVSANLAEHASRDQVLAEFAATVTTLVRHAGQRLGHDRAALVHHMAYQPGDTAALRRCCLVHEISDLRILLGEAVVRLAEQLEPVGQPAPSPATGDGWRAALPVPPSHVRRLDLGPYGLYDRDEHDPGLWWYLGTTGRRTGGSARLGQLLEMAAHLGRDLVEAATPDGAP